MLSLKKFLIPSSEVTQDDLLLVFKEQYIKEREFIRASIYWMVNSNDVDDLVQETFFKAWKNFRSFESKSSFKTWVYRIAMNLTYDYLKKNKGYIQDLHEEHIDSRELNIEMSDLISKGLMTLSIDQREAFSLHYQVGLTYLETSKLLNIPEGTVKSRVNNAKVRFVEFLKKNGVSNG